MTLLLLLLLLTMMMITNAQLSSVEVVSGRELAFTFAICYRRSVCRLSSVVCLVVCDVGAPYSAG